MKKILIVLTILVSAQSFSSSIPAPYCLTVDNIGNDSVTGREVSFEYQLGNQVTLEKIEPEALSLANLIKGNHLFKLCLDSENSSPQIVNIDFNATFKTIDLSGNEDGTCTTIKEINGGLNITF